jgi:hypothetical protein
VAFTLICWNSSCTPGSGFAAEHHLPTGWGSRTLEFARSRNPHKNLPGSLDWKRPTNLLAPAFAGYHTAGFLFLGVCQGSSVCYPWAWPSYVTRPHPWCVCLSNSGHVGQNMTRNWVQTWHYSCHQWVKSWSVLNWLRLHIFFEFLFLTPQIVFI